MGDNVSNKVNRPQFTKLGGKAWGVRGPNPEPQTGEKISVITRTGQVREVTIGYILSREPAGSGTMPDGTPYRHNGQWLASIENSHESPDPASATAGTGSTYNGPRRTAKVKRVAYYRPSLEAVARLWKHHGPIIPPAVLLAEIFNLSQTTVANDIAAECGKVSP